MKTYTANGLLITIDDNAELNRGGEGRIMLLKKNADKVAKLYFSTICPPTEAHLKALQVLDDRYFVKPEQLLYEAPNKQKIVGFIMPRLSNQYYPFSALFSLPFCQKKGITPQKKWTLAQQIIDAVKDAHQKGIIIGDLSGLNILVNDQNIVKFIDVDSYQSSIHTHSGILLDEIRDCYYGGNVSPQSDWFAVAVILFQLFTYAHPFKGIHKTYLTLAERMIQRIPVFAADKYLTAPKCYQPLQDVFLQQQFEAIFMQGHRTPLQLNSGITMYTTGNLLKTLTPLPQTQLATSAMHVSRIWEFNGHERLLDAYTCGQYLVLKTNLQYRIYDLSIQTRTQLTTVLPADQYSHFWVGNKYAIAANNGQFYGISPNDGTTQPLKNLYLTPDSRIAQYGNILAIVEPDFLRTVYIDEQNTDFIRFEQQPIFGAGLHVGTQGMKQHIGGQTYLWFRAGNVLATALSPAALQDVFIFENHALIVQADNTSTSTTTNNYNGTEKRLQYRFANIHSNLQVKIAQQTTENLKHITYRALNKQHGLVFEPADDSLLIRRTEDFQILQTIDCHILTDETRLFNSHAGIVAVCTDAVWLLNKKA